MSVTVTYKGNTLATVENATKTLKTAGKYMEGDVTLTDVSSVPMLQAKTNIDPTTSSQTITADTGYDGLSSVQINAMPNGSAIAPATISGTDATVSKSTDSITLSKSISVTPLVTPGYVASGSTRNCDVSLTVPTAQTARPSVIRTINTDHTASFTAQLNLTNVHGYGTYYPSGVYESQSPAAVAASELVSGTLDVTDNGLVDVTNYMYANVNVSGGGGGVETTLVDGVSASGILYYTDANMTPQSGNDILGLYLPAGTLIFVYNNGPTPPAQPVNVTEIARYGSVAKGQYIVYSVDTLTS